MQNYLNKLEYDKILTLLSSNSKTYLGKVLCLDLKPSNSKDKVVTLLKETDEACTLLLRKGNLPISDFEDISLSVKNLESNISLSAKALLDIANVLRISRDLKEYFYKDEDFDLSNFSILDSYFSRLYSNKTIEYKIFNCIIDENTIADDASTVLANLRRNRRKLENQIKDTLNKIIHSNTKAIMDPIVTIRNDRYVIPVKEDFKGQIKGFVHDVSASGSTVFVEPMAVFELNNSISNIKVEESIEIEKILANLSSLLFDLTAELNNDVYLLGKLDFIFAKASFSKSISAICPIVNDNKCINLIKARHPLIDKDKVVPIDVEIGKNYSSLIITGPNTGGKTVTLKTVGLLTLMACSGLFIPAEENSSIYVFDNVFADIGDEQSIEESLSTFSSHISNVVHIINNSTSNSLILLDELGSGTDPVEGSSLAISILEHFYSIEAITFATTHYPEIKNYALVTDGFENASSDFDIENLKPTYKLLIGIPGKSNAFAISKKLGISNDILDRAKSFLKEDEINIEELLKNIYDDKLIIESEKDEITKNKNQIELLRKSLEQEKNTQNDLKEDKIEKAKIEAKNLLLDAKEDANSTIKELNTLYNNLKDFEEIDLDNWSDTQIANFVKKHFKKGTLKQANLYRNKLNSSLDKFNSTNSNIENINNSEIKHFSKDDLCIGMKIKLSNFNDIATIISLSGKKNILQVQVGNIKTNISLDDIVEINIKDKGTNNTRSKASSVTSFKSKEVTPEINVIGQNIEEACFVIDKYLDDCVIAKLSPVRIVHGKGTGKLREGIHNFLRKNSHVKSFRLGTFGEGEMGVTVVELK